MIIKPYLAWPKLSTLKIGDIVKWKDNQIKYLNISPEDQFITITNIEYEDDDNGGIDYRPEFRLINNWYAYRYEIKLK